MENIKYGFKQGIMYAPWRQLGREVRINVQMSDGTIFNENNVTFLKITDDGNILDTYMKKAVLKIQATDETENQIKDYVDNADYINIEYGVYYADEIAVKNYKGDYKVTIPAGTANMIRIPTMYVSHDETDTEYDEVTKIATFTCYDAMWLLANTPMSSVKATPLGYAAPDVLSKIEEIVNVDDRLKTVLEKEYSIGETANGTTIGYTTMTALRAYNNGLSIRDYLNNLSNALYCAFCIRTDIDGTARSRDYLCVNNLHVSNTAYVSDITIDDIRSISLSKERNAITGLVYRDLYDKSVVLGSNEGNVVYKYTSMNGLKADWLSDVAVRHSSEREELLSDLKGLGKLKNFDITTYGMPWIDPLTCVEYTNMKGTVSKLLVNSSVLTISNGITQRFYNQSIDTLFEDQSEKSEDIENLNVANATISESMTPISDKACNIGTSEQRFDTVYCVETNTTSDLKNKENIQGLVDNDKLIDFFKSMKPCSFTMKDGDTGRIHMGFIAQWCAEAAKETMGDLSFFEASYINEKGECEYFRNDVDDSELSWGLKLNQLIAPLWAVVQIQFDKIENLEKQIEELKNGN